MGRNAIEASTRVPLEGRKPREADFIYFAGLFDGEGSIDVMNGATPRLKISMTDGPTIRWLLDTFGGRVYPEKPSGSARKMAWKWTLITRVDVEFVLRCSLDHLITKSQRAQCALDVLEFSSIARGSSYKDVHWLAERDGLLEKVRARGWPQRMYDGTADESAKT